MTSLLNEVPSAAPCVARGPWLMRRGRIARRTVVAQYRMMAGSLSRYMTEQYIELFDLDLVTLPRNLPDWYIEQMAMLVRLMRHRTRRQHVLLTIATMAARGMRCRAARPTPSGLGDRRRDRSVGRGSGHAGALRLSHHIGTRHWPKFGIAQLLLPARSRQ